MDELEALALADDLRAAYPGRIVTDDSVNRWARQLRKMTAYEAREVVKHLTIRSADPPSTAQVHQALAEVQRKTMSPKFDMFRCVYADGMTCYNCDPEGIVHGHLLEPADVAAKMRTLNDRQLPSCGECGVVHIRRTHAEYRTRLVAAFQLYLPKATKAPVS